LFVVAINAFLGILDIAAVLVLGLVGALAISTVNGSSPGNRIESLLQILNLADNNPRSQVALLGLLAATVLTFKSVASLLLSRKILFFLSRRSAAISKILITKLLGQEILKVRNRTTQESIFALTTGVGVVTINILGSSLILISDLFLIVAFGISLFIVDTLVAVSSLILFLCIGMTLYYLMNKKALQLGEEATRLNIASNDKIGEVISCYRELLVKNQRLFYAKKIGSMRLGLAEASARLGFMGLVSKYVMEIGLVFGGLCIGAIQFLTQPSNRAVAVISVFLVSSARIAPAVLRIQTGMMNIKNHIGTARPTLDLIEEFVAEDPYIENVDNKRMTNFSRIHEDFKAKIDVRSISFAYPGRKNKAINEVSLRVSEGEFVGVVGPSGSGKSTFMDSLLGVINPDEGEVYISDAPPTQVYSKWPGAVAYVPQESNMINGTIKENVCLGFEPDEIPDQLVEEVLDAVQLGEFLLLPASIHSPIGERGTKLSGGQRQRLGIARALITRPKLLLLDEATSSLDSLTESKIANYLYSIKGSLTMIVVAHRLSTIKEADKILYFRSGLMLGMGTFQELKDSLPEMEQQAKAMGL
jgi:ABC-type multidrug transport system fused ATPase/permease subunit